MEEYTQSEQFDQQGVNNKGEQVKSAYLQTSKACLGTKERRRKKWITPGTWQAIITREDSKTQLIGTKSERLKEKYKQQYQEADRRVKRGS